MIYDIFIVDKESTLQLEVEHEEYARKIKKFDRQELSLRQFCTEIVNRVARAHLVHATTAEDTPAVIRNLAKRFQPMEDWRRREIISQYTKIRDDAPVRIDTEV